MEPTRVALMAANCQSLNLFTHVMSYDVTLLHSLRIVCYDWKFAKDKGMIFELYCSGRIINKAFDSIIHDTYKY